MSLKFADGLGGTIQLDNLASTELDNLGTTAINADLIFDKATPVVKSSNKTASDNSENVTISSGTTVDGNSGEVILNPGTPSGAGNRGASRIYGSNISLSADLSVGIEAFGNITIAPDGDLRVVPYASTTPILELWEGTGSLFTQLKATDNGGLNINGEGSIVEVRLGPDLVPNFWGSDVPALVIDGTSAAANTANGAGILFKGDDAAPFLIVSQDRTDGVNSASIWMTTGIQDFATGNSGDFYIYTGDVTGAGNGGNVTILTGGSDSGNSGELILSTGNSNSNTSGSITLQVGGGTTSGHINLAAPFVQFAYNNVDPAGAGAGAVYYNTVDAKLKLFNGSTWETITSI